MQYVPFACNSGSCQFSRPQTKGAIKGRDLQQLHPFSIKPETEQSFYILLLQVSQMACVEDGAVAKGEMKVAFMVVLMVLTFLISWLPYASLAMFVVHNPDVEIHPLVGTVPVYMAKSSTVYNPIIYIYLNKQVYKCIRIYTAVMNNCT